MASPPAPAPTVQMAKIQLNTLRMSGRAQAAAANAMKMAIT